jgi:hypothetical protein
MKVARHDLGAERTMPDRTEAPSEITVEHDERKHRYLIKRNGDIQLYVLSSGMRHDGELWAIVDAGYAQILELRGSSKASATARAVAMLKDGDADPAMQQHRARRQGQRKVSLQMAIEDSAAMPEAAETRALAAIFDTEVLSRVDVLRSILPGVPTRAAAVRMLVELALSSALKGRGVRNEARPPLQKRNAVGPQVR